MSPRAIGPLVEALADDDGGVRCAAAEALGNMGPAAREAVPVLEKLLRDKDPGIRQAAAEALKRIREEQGQGK